MEDKLSDGSEGFEEGMDVNRGVLDGSRRLEKS
jgi:hypothetical protein